MTTQGRVLYAALELLDHQLVDRDGAFAGNVDDVEIDLPADWPNGASDEQPVVRALLSGPGVLAERFGGRLGRGWAALHRRLHPGTSGEGAIPMAHVRAIGSAVQLALPRDELASDRMEDWFRRHVIAKIPGAGRAPE
jgi:hypothetical protein